MDFVNQWWRKYAALWHVGLLVVLLGGIIACGGGDRGSGTIPSSDGAASIGGALPPRVSMDQAMVSWINPASYAIWDAARESLAPTDDASWKRLEDFSVQLLASASWITIGGTGPSDAEWVSQEGWRAYSRQMADAAEAALVAARRQDLDSLVAAGNSLVETCEGCHLDYRPEPGY